MQCPGKADTKAVLGLAITIRREAGVKKKKKKILCDTTQSPERKKEAILVGPLELFPQGDHPSGTKVTVQSHVGRRNKEKGFFFFLSYF